MEKRYWERADFWKDAGERIVTSFLEGTIGLVTMNMMLGWVGVEGLHAEPWQYPLAGGIMAALSTIKAIVGTVKTARAKVSGSDTGVSPVSVL